MGNWVEYKDATTVLERDLYRFISEFSYDFTKEELETFRKAYGFVQARQNMVADEIRKEWRK